MFLFPGVLGELHTSVTFGTSLPERDINAAQSWAETSLRAGILLANGKPIFQIML